MKTVRDFNVKQKRVLLRCDFNVPLDEKRNILDDFRIKQSLPTIDYLVEKEAKLILMSHLGRPEGKVVENLRLSPIQDSLMEYLDLSITKAPDCIGKEIEPFISQMQPGEILLLENLRFHKEEEENDENFAKKLARLGEIFINDAFSVCHREHASVVQIPRFLPSGMGFLLEKEIKTLGNLLRKPQRPLISLVAGKKVESKVKLIDKISAISDFVLIGSLIEEEIEKKHISLRYPQKIVKPIDSIFEGERCLSIGPKTVRLFQEKIKEAKTVFWSGPFGKIEEEKYSKATEELTRTIVESGAFSVVGGGETIAFVNKIGLTESFNHISTGGGAMLAFLSGEKLPGIEALK